MEKCSVASKLAECRSLLCKLGRRETDGVLDAEASSAATAVLRDEQSFEGKKSGVLVSRGQPDRPFQAAHLRCSALLKYGVICYTTRSLTERQTTKANRSFSTVNKQVV